MKKSNSLVKYTERRTFIKGTFTGKYIGHLAYRSSHHQDVNIYDIEVTQGKMVTEMNAENLRKWNDGEDESYRQLETLKCAFPEEIPCIIHYPDGVVKEFLIQLQSPKIHQPALSNQVYDGKDVFGDINGDISGYISHWVQVDDDTENVILPVKEKETEGNYIRYKNINVDGSTTFSDWRYREGDSGGCLNSIFGVIGWIFVLLALLLVGWKILLPLLLIAVIGFIYYLFFSAIFWLFRMLMRPLLLLLLLLALFSIYGIFNHHLSDIKPRGSPIDHKEETTTISDNISDQGDSLIIHHRIWSDMDANRYEKDIIIKKSELKTATSFHTGLQHLAFDQNGYHKCLEQLIKADQPMLGFMYAMLDSLQNEVDCDRLRFAKAVVSMVQDIPYKLILHGECDVSLYKDQFTRQYLRSGRECVGNVPFGVYSPVEFLGTLNGDCDTRTLFLFLVLRQYNYDVVLLGSEVYQHSVLGIDMDLPGLSKNVNFKKYVVWETTAPGIPYGVLDKDISDMKYWNVILSNKN